MFGLTEKITGIIGGVMAFAMVGLAAALFITRGTLEKRTAERDAAFAQVQTEQAKHAVTRQSLDQALAEIQRRNAEAEARAKAYAEAKAKDAQTIAKLDELAKDSAHRIAILEGIRQHAETTGTCAVAPGILEQAEGL
jgi:Flp pilus assembly protein TadB